MRRLVSFAAMLLLAIVGTGESAAAQGVDVIRGQVIGPDNLPMSNATVTATSVDGGVNRTARTGADGRYTITFPGAEGDYFMNFTAIGYAPRRFELKRLADEDILVADAELTRTLATLDTVHVSERDRVARDADKQPDIGGTEQTVTNEAVAPNEQGDLNALAGSIPGSGGGRRSNWFFSTWAFGGSEQHNAQRKPVRRREPAARCQRLVLDRDGAV